MARKTKTEKVLENLQTKIGADLQVRHPGLKVSIHERKIYEKICGLEVKFHFTDREIPQRVFLIHIYTRGDRKVRWEAETDYVFSSPEYYKMVSVLYRKVQKYHEMFLAEVEAA